MHVIYALYWAKSDSVYVGRTNSVRNRVEIHNRMGTTNTHYNHMVQEQYSKYGEPEFIQLELCEDIEAITLEKVWISQFDKNVLNLQSVDVCTTPFVTVKPRPKIDTSIKCRAVLIDGDGVLHYVNSVVEFCKHNTILNKTWDSSVPEVRKVILGTRKSHKRFRLYDEHLELPPLRHTYTVCNKSLGITISNIDNLSEYCRNEPLLANNWYNNADNLRKIAAGRRKKSINGFQCYYTL